MLNKKDIRELCYLVTVDGVEPIPGRDRVEAAIVGGWKCMVPKGQFSKGSIGIYFEVDSKVNTTQPYFEFLSKYNGKVKTQRYKNSDGTYFYSQGLLMHPQDFGWITYEESPGGRFYVEDNKGNTHYVDDESRFLTAQLGVIYADAEDNARKAPAKDVQVMSMKARHKKLFTNRFVKKMMKYAWFRDVMLFLFGKKKEKRNWPSHIAAKTDVERVNNMIWILNDKKPYVASEKVDGCSCSVMCERDRFGRLKYYVCSRNVVFENPTAKCYYDTNVYFEMYEKYNLKDIITKIINDYNLPNVAIQMEIYGSGIQKREYSLANGEHQVAVFHIVSNGVKFPMDRTIEICEKYGLPHVPIVNDNYILPDTIEEMQKFVEGEMSRIDGKPREGIVFYDKETGQQYFKFVSPEFLMKYHK